MSENVMMAEDDSARRKRSRTQTEVEHASVGRLSLETFWTHVTIPRSPGNVLLIQGAPAPGRQHSPLNFSQAKGTRIGPHTISANKVYVSSRVSSSKLHRHFLES